MIYCSSTANGGDSNGFDDNHSYVFALETKGTIKWKRVLGGKFTNVAATPLTWSGGKSTKVTSTALRGLGDEVRIVAKVDVGTGFEATRPRLLLLEGSTGRALDSIYYDGQILSRLVATEEPEENSWAVFCSMRNRILRKYRATDKEITFVKEKRFSKGNCFCCHRFF